METLLQLPVFALIEKRITLEYKGIVLAHILNLEWQSQRLPTLMVRDRGNIVFDLLPHPFEALIQVTSGEISIQKPERKLEQWIQISFLSFRDSYLFFPELVDFINSQIDDYDEVTYDRLSEIVFSEYGSNGFGIGPYDSHMMVDTGEGVMLLNNYIFEDQVANLLPGDKVWLRVDEALLLSMAGPRSLVKTVNEKHSEPPQLRFAD